MPHKSQSFPRILQFLEAFADFSKSNIRIKDKFVFFGCHKRKGPHFFFSLTLPVLFVLGVGFSSTLYMYLYILGLLFRIGAWDWDWGVKKMSLWPGHS